MIVLQWLLTGLFFVAGAILLAVVVAVVARLHSGRWPD